MNDFMRKRQQEMTHLAFALFDRGTRSLDDPASLAFTGADESAQAYSKHAWKTGRYLLYAWARDTGHLYAWDDHYEVSVNPAPAVAPGEHQPICPCCSAVLRGAQTRRDADPLGWVCTVQAPHRNAPGSLSPFNGVWSFDALEIVRQVSERLAAQAPADLPPGVPGGRL